MDSKQAMAKESNTVLGNASKAYLEGRGRQAYEGYQRAVELMSQTKKKVRRSDKFLWFKINAQNLD